MAAGGQASQSLGAPRMVRFEGESCFRVTQVASAIGSKPRHRGTLRALGLGRIGKSRILPDRPEIRGMLSLVAHLVDVTPTTEKRVDRPRTARRGANRGVDRIGSRRR
jgi:large subunit ribosomal protein L30